MAKKSAVNLISEEELNGKLGILEDQLEENLNNMVDGINAINKQVLYWMIGLTVLGALNTASVIILACCN